MNLFVPFCFKRAAKISTISFAPNFFQTFFQFFGIQSQKRSFTPSISVSLVNFAKDRNNKNNNTR